MESLKEKFEQEKTPAKWRELRPHFARDTVIIVSLELDICDVAVAVAKDESEKVQDWIQTGALRKPSIDEAEVWEKQLSRLFQMVIVQPFVLIQDEAREV